MLREIIRTHPELKDLGDELLPYRTDWQSGTNLTAIVDDESLKQFGQYSEKSLIERAIEQADHLEEARPPVKLFNTKKKNSRDLEDIEDEEIDDEVEDILEDEFFQAASNSWAVMGEYTESGMPMLANDFHMGANCPSMLTIGELQWGED